MTRRTLREIKQDLRKYLSMLYLMEEAGAQGAVTRYRRHVAAVQNELEQRLMLVHS